MTTGACVVLSNQPRPTQRQQRLRIVYRERAHTVITNISEADTLRGEASLLATHCKVSYREMADATHNTVSYSSFRRVLRDKKLPRNLLHREAVLRILMGLRLAHATHRLPLDKDAFRGTAQAKTALIKRHTVRIIQESANHARRIVEANASGWKPA